jgi:hypothetical protein
LSGPVLVPLREPKLEQDIADLFGLPGLSGRLADPDSPETGGACANSPERRDRTCRSIEMSRRSMRANTATIGRSSFVDRGHVLGDQRFTRQSRNAMSASSRRILSPCPRERNRT